MNIRSFIPITIIATAFFGISFNETIYASAYPTVSGISQAILAGNVGADKNAVYSLVTINASNMTNGDFTEDINITLSDIASGNEYRFALTNDTNYMTVVNVIANTTYSILLEYLDTDKFFVLNSDGSAIGKFGATADGNNLNWIITDSNDSKSANVAGTKSISSISISDDSDASDVFQKFYDTVKGMDGNQKWDGFFSTYVAYEKIQAQQYMDTCGGTTDDWLKMSNFDRFLWYETYIRIVNYMGLANYDRFFSSEQNYLTNTIDNAYHDLLVYGDGTEAAAYKTLMLWQYDYIIQNGTVYNFMTNQNSSNSDQISEPSIQPDETQGIQKEDQPEINTRLQDLTKDPVQENLKTNKVTEKSIWGKTFSRVKSSYVTIIILIILCAGLAGIVIYRKSKVIDDDKEE